MKLRLFGDSFASDTSLTHMSNVHIWGHVFGKAVVEHADNDGAIRLVPPWSEQSIADGGLTIGEKMGKLIMAWDEWGA